MRSTFVLILCGLLAFSCNTGKEKRTYNEVQHPRQTIIIPKFMADSAFIFVKNQVDFGPRVPNSKSHHKAGKYLVTTLKKFNNNIIEQDFESVSCDGQKLFLKNIIASFHPEKQKRILLAAHWDTRPFADNDKINPNALFDGANDGASGVGILLEIARILKTNTTPNVGVDIIFFDGEDGGERNSTHVKALPVDLESWWCLGSQYWAKHKHQNNYSAFYGILLDMVGAKDAKFYREEISLKYAPSIVEKIWNAGAKLGYSHVFIKQNVGSVTDDHLFVNESGKIPMADIIPYDMPTGSFGDFHHTRKDNINLISKNTLQAVGETILTVLYQEE